MLYPAWPMIDRATDIQYTLTHGIRWAGSEETRANFSAKCVAIRHDPALGEETLTAALMHLGFEAQPVSDNPLGDGSRERKALTRALGVAGFGMMNVMLPWVSIWSGAVGATRALFPSLSALTALPVIAYAGRPFFASAWTALRHRRTSMDVPISIGVLLATGLSLCEAVRGGEHAFFDPAMMLLFFLLADRALNAAMRTRTRARIGALRGRMGKSASVIAPEPVGPGAPPAEAHGLTARLCNGGTITIPLGDGGPSEVAPCRPKACHAGPCHEKTDPLRPKRAI